MCFKFEQNNLKMVCVDYGCDNTCPFDILLTKFVERLVFNVLARQLHEKSQMLSVHLIVSENLFSVLLGIQSISSNQSVWNCLIVLIKRSSK